MKTTEELAQAVEAYQKGDKEAFTDLYEQSYRYLYTCIMYIVRSEDTTQDMLQETYLEIVKKIETLRSTEDFLNWAAVIATHKCFAYLKKNRDLLAEGAEGTFEEIPDDEGMIPEEVMQDKEKQRLFREIIDSLSGMQRLCVIGYYYNEQSQESLAQELGIPVGTVKSHLNRARARIKLAVEELDVKKDTRLYNVAPLVLVLMEEEIKSCIVQPMSAALAAGAGAGKVTAEGFSIVRKLKALWAKLSAGAKAKAAAGAVAACTAGAVAAVAFTQDEMECPVISKEEKELFDQIMELCRKEKYEELCMLDFSVVEQEEDYIGINEIYYRDENGEKISERFFHKEKGEKVYTWYYDGESYELKPTLSGYGFLIIEDKIAVGYFENGQVVGECVCLSAWVSNDKTRRGKFSPVGETETLIRTSKMNVEEGAIVGKVSKVDWIDYTADGVNKPFLGGKSAGYVVPVRVWKKDGTYYTCFCYDGRVEYKKDVYDMGTYYLNVIAGRVDPQRHQDADGRWFDEEGRLVYTVDGEWDTGKISSRFRIMADESMFDMETMEIIDVQETE